MATKDHARLLRPAGVGEGPAHFSIKYSGLKYMDFFLHFKFFFLHFEGCKTLWCFLNSKILRCTIIKSMVHLFFHQFFWVSNWNIFDESIIYSYTLKGGEFNGKVFFFPKTKFL